MILLLTLLIAASPIEDFCDRAAALAALSQTRQTGIRQTLLYREVAATRQTVEIAEAMVDIGRVSGSTAEAMHIGRTICMNRIRRR